MMDPIGSYAAYSSTFTSGQIAELTVEIRKLKTLIPALATTAALRENPPSAQYPFGNMFPETADQLRTELDAIVAKIAAAEA